MTRKTHEVQGSIVIRQHCTFIWRQTESAYQRLVDVELHHYEVCVGYLAKQSGFILNDLRKPPRSGAGG